MLDSTAAAKVELRRVAIEARRSQSAAERETARAAIRDLVLVAARDGSWRTVAAYEPLHSEPSSTELLAGLRDVGAQVLVPVTLPDRDLDWTVWTPDGAGPPLGRDAIGTADAVLVPALAVARDGTRLGRGGGSYDRALPRCRAAVPRIAILYDGEAVDDLPAAEWDVPVSDIVTPSGWVRTEAGGRSRR